jgi:4-amino-4-deoxy-L-arabinose transferase-like glycosyltransferase
VTEPAAAPPASRTLRIPRRDLLLLAAIGALLFLPALGRRDVWNPDEARYAEVAREMQERGSWAVPYLNGAVYAEKPPLMFWSIIAAGALTGGIGETASRLPSALAGIAALLLVFRIAERLFGRRAAWLAALAFATCFKVLWQARFGQIDMLLTALVTLGVWFWVRGYTEDRPRLYLFFYAAAGLATLAKGPVGLLPPLLSILAFLIVIRNPGEIKRLHLGLGLLLWAAIVCAWLIPAGLAAGPDYLQRIVFRQNVTRYAEPWHHFQPWYYYLTVIPPEFFPWSFLLPSAFVVARRRLGGQQRQGFVFALCWIAVTLVFFSLSPAKRSVYVLTLYPALALVVGAILDRLAAEWPRDRVWLERPLALLAGLTLLLAAALLFAGKDRPELVPLGGRPFLWLLAVALLPLLAGSAWAWWESRSGRVERVAAGLGAGMGLTFLLAAFLILPRFDALKSARGLSRVLVANAPAGAPYGIYPRLDPTFLFYTHRFAENLDRPEKLYAFVNRPGPVWLLIQRDELAKLVRPLPPMRELARDADPREGYVLMVSSAAAQTPPP